MDPIGVDGGRFRIAGVLGRGGMGTVYRAWDEVEKRWVALKRIRPRWDGSWQWRERFRQGVRAASALRHPSVARVYGAFEDEGAEYLVMELVEGRTLASVVAEGPLDPARAVVIARKIAEGLAAIHAGGIVHGDLDGGNVMIEAGGRVVILDLGLAGWWRDRAQGLERLPVAMGTPEAMSPEQARGLPVDHRSDLFSLGSLLYEMLAGRHPFRARTPLETMQRVAGHEPEPLPGARAGLPGWIVQIVHWLLAKDPAQRPRDAAAVVRLLDTSSHTPDGVPPRAG